MSKQATHEKTSVKSTPTQKSKVSPTDLKVGVQAQGKQVAATLVKQVSASVAPSGFKAATTGFQP